MESAAVVGAFEGKHVRRINRAKRKHREDLENWSEQNYCATWHCGIKPQLLAQIPHKRAEVIPRMTSKQYAKCTVQSPCIITDCTETWPAKQRWTFQQFLLHKRKEKLKCGEDDEGYSLKVTLDTFLRYQNAQSDDSPLYVFDSHNKFICNDYTVPEIFAQDLFQYVGERKRPPYRWFLVGPERSGSTIHIDPLQTSAWNASLQGRKLWAVFSPEVDRQIVKGRKYKKKDDEAIDWFVQMMPHILENDLPPTAKFYYFIQQAGETVFVPSGWWHVVLNLDDTIAVTQNFGKPAFFFFRCANTCSVR